MHCKDAGLLSAYGCGFLSANEETDSRRFGKKKKFI